MKKLCSLLLTLVLLCTLCIPAFAESETETEEETRAFLLQFIDHKILCLYLDADYTALSDSAALTVFNTKNEAETETYKKDSIFVFPNEGKDHNQLLLVVPLKDYTVVSKTNSNILSFPIGALVKADGRSNTEEWTLTANLSTLINMKYESRALQSTPLLLKYKNTLNVLPLEQDASFRFVRHGDGDETVNAILSRIHFRSDNTVCSFDDFCVNTSELGTVSYEILFDETPLCSVKFDIVSEATLKLVKVPGNILRVLGAIIMIPCLPLFLVGGIPVGWASTFALSVAFIGGLPLTPITVPTFGTGWGVVLGAGHWYDLFETLIRLS